MHQKLLMTVHGYLLILQESRRTYDTAVSGVVLHLNSITVKWSNSPKPNHPDFPKTNRADFQTCNVRFMESDVYKPSETTVLKMQQKSFKINIKY